MARSSQRRSPLALVVLALLAEEPMHPYLMQRKIKLREKDKIANVAQRNSVYQTIDRLLREGLIAVRDTERDERRPERTIYEITDTGWDTLLDWTRAMLATRTREFPEFPAALATLMVLEPSDVLRQLEARADALEAELAEHRSEAEQTTWLPRLFRLDNEFASEQAAAELRWVRSIIDDLKSGRLTWNEAELREFARTVEPE